MESKKPIHQHDCNECDFLGIYEQYDLYYCKSKGIAPEGTVLARWSSTPQDYTSGLQLAKLSKDGTPLKEAYNRAMAKGLLTPLA